MIDLSGLDSEQAIVAVLSDGRWHTVSDVGSRVGLDDSTVEAAVTHMVDAGVVVRGTEGGQEELLQLAKLSDDRVIPLLEFLQNGDQRFPWKEVQPLPGFTLAQVVETLTALEHLRVVSLELRDRAHLLARIREGDAARCQ